MSHADAQDRSRNHEGHEEHEEKPKTGLVQKPLSLQALHALHGERVFGSGSCCQSLRERMSHADAQDRSRNHEGHEEHEEKPKTGLVQKPLSLQALHALHGERVFGSGSCCQSLRERMSHADAQDRSRNHEGHEEHEEKPKTGLVQKPLPLQALHALHGGGL